MATPPDYDNDLLLDYIRDETHEHNTDFSSVVLIIGSDGAESPLHIESTVPGLLTDLADFTSSQSHPDRWQPKNEGPWNALLQCDLELLPSMLANDKGKLECSHANSGCYEATDSGYYSSNQDSSTLYSLEPHLHWCLLCEKPGPMANCKDWEKHMRKHEVRSICLGCVNV